MFRQLHPLKDEMVKSNYNGVAVIYDNCLHILTHTDLLFYKVKPNAFYRIKSISKKVSNTLYILSIKLGIICKVALVRIMLFILHRLRIIKNNSFL